MKLQTVVVTGASSGIGKEIATKFVQEGFQVILAARSFETLQQLEEILNNQGPGKALAVQTDVSNPNSVKKMIQQGMETFGDIDILVNNAGLMLSAKVTDGNVEAWEDMVDVNVKGILYTTNEVINSMIARKQGHIINVSSVSGQEVTKNSTVYSATKFAVRAITAGLEKELAHTGVRVTNISPGMVETRLIDGYELKRKPLDPTDIANAIYYAISQPSYVNVNEITVRPV
ncbi:SDR family oxidoreductase [Pseudogracilibacillus sp. ICA-222130]|uniref:SDR family oxidoreductase n=1 Tax=Pseudogracilibacillus sp. ICA-222130 TaxID=3134655 RepID=UPI0030BD1364